MKKEKSVTVGVRCSPEEAQAWKAFADGRDLTFSDFVKSLIRSVVKPDHPPIQDPVTQNGPEALESVLQETQKDPVTQNHVTQERSTDADLLHTVIKKTSSRKTPVLCRRCERVAREPACPECMKAFGSA